MRFVRCYSIMLVLSVVFLGISHGAPEPPVVAVTGPRTPAEEQKCFHLPPGFDIELVASEPAIIKPIQMNFDDRNRLWVTQSVEYPFAAPRNRQARDTVKIFASTNGHGVADKVSTFADGLNIPIGVLPVPGGCIAYSIPNIYRFLDTDGDGRADKREMLYGSIGVRDTHGMTGSFTWGFDGWIYACHGFANDSVLKGSDGQAIKLNSGNTYRMKPDGSHVEYYTHGQVNPFGLCFDPLGNLYSADCHTQPVMALLRGGYYQSFGKPHDGLGYAPEMVSGYDRSTAIAGIVYYAADHFPPAYRACLYFGDVVVNQVNMYRLEPHGSSFVAKLEPKFLTCDDPWFRPVDVKLGPDGALYIADFYNRIIGHYEVPLTHPGRDHTRGRIWRIVYRGPDGKGKPVAPRADWTTAAIADLVNDLKHPNLVVRMKATNQLVERGSEAVPAVRAVMQSATPAFQRMHGLWILARLHALDDGLLEAAARDSDRGVRVHAMKVLGERPQLPEHLRSLAVAGLRDTDPFVGRAAADALGRHPQAENVGPLLALRHTVAADDTHLLHVVRMALRDQLEPAEVWRQLPMSSWTEKDKRAIADVAAGAATPEAAGYLLVHVQHYPESNENLLRYVHHVARYGKEDMLDGLLTFAREQQPDNLRHQAALFKALQQGMQERGTRLSKAGKEWAQQLIQHLLVSTSNEELLAGAEMAGSLQLKSAAPNLARLSANKKLPEPQRRAALDALRAIDARRHIGLFGDLLEDAAEPMPIREHAAFVLAGINSPEANAELVKSLAVAPARLQNTIATGLAASLGGAEKLLDAVAAGKASARLLQEGAVPRRLEQHAKLKQRIAVLTKGLPSVDQRMQELITRRREGFGKASGDMAAGIRVFEKSCAICHQVAGKGAKVGPNLDGVGNRGLDRLLEDIIDPNRNVDQAFRSTTLALKNGQIVSGLVLREEGEVVIVADAQGKEVRITKGSIDERNVSQLSPMPANLVEQIPEPDFYNLLSYLLSLRPIKETKPGP